MGAVSNETRIVASVPCEATATTASKDNNCLCGNFTDLEHGSKLPDSSSGHRMSASRQNRPFMTNGPFCLCVGSGVNFERLFTHQLFGERPHAPKAMPRPIRNECSIPKSSPPSAR
jgi:hypothetical protein